MKRFIIVAILTVAVHGRRGGVEVVYDGDACECDKSLSFCVDRPREAAGVQLGSFGYDVVVPQRAPERETHYNFDYQIQTPVESGSSRLLQGLQTEVDRVLVHREDCARPISSCSGNTYTPHIDVLETACAQNCRHRRSISVEDYAAATGNSNQFYDRTRPLEQLLGDGSDDDAGDDLFKPKTNGGVGRHQLRLKIKQFFDALRRQRDDQTPVAAQTPAAAAASPPQAAGAPQQPTLEQRGAALRAKWADMLAQRNIIPKDRLRLRRKRRNITPEYAMSEATGADATEMSGEVLRPRKHCPMCGHENACSICGGGMMAPDEADDDEPLEAAASAQYVELLRGEQVPYQLRSAAGSVASAASAASAAAASAASTIASAPRYVFDRLGHRYIERDGRLRLVSGGEQQQQSPPPSQPQPQQSQSFDGVRFVQQQQQQVLAPMIGAPPPTDEYGVLADILNKNHAILHASNIEGGHMIAPPLELATETFGFLHELGDRDSTKHHNYDYSLGQQQQQQPQSQSQSQPQQPTAQNADQAAQMSQQSYKFVPLLQDKRDGSLLVRIAPHKSGKKNSKRPPATYQLPPNFVVDSSRQEDDSSRSYSSAEAWAYSNNNNNHFNNRDGSGYDIVSLVDGKAMRMNPNNKDFDVLRLIYDAQTDDRHAASSDAARSVHRYVEERRSSQFSPSFSEASSGERMQGPQPDSLPQTSEPVMAEFET